MASGPLAEPGLPLLKPRCGEPPAHELLAPSVRTWWTQANTERGFDQTQHVERDVGAMLQHLVLLPLLLLAR